jgi:hypothetical protein
MDRADPVTAWNGARFWAEQHHVAAGLPSCMEVPNRTLSGAPRAPDVPLSAVAEPGPSRRRDGPRAAYALLKQRLDGERRLLQLRGVEALAVLLRRGEQRLALGEPVLRRDQHRRGALPGARGRALSCLDATANPATERLAEDDELISPERRLDAVADILVRGLARLLLAEASRGCVDQAQDTGIARDVALLNGGRDALMVERGEEPSATQGGRTR